MAGSSGFAISITAVDKTAGALDGINKRLAKLSAPAERFSKALSKFGDVSGINRVSEGFGSLGRTAHDAFMSIDRVSGPLAAITGAASIAGIVALTQRWAELGSTIGRTGFKLALPVEKLSAVQGAGRRFGATTEQVTQSLSGLRETLYGAAWGRDPAALQALRALHIDPGTPGHITDTMKALDEVADRVAGEKDVHTKLRIMGSVGLDQSLLPLMNKGSKGIHEEMQRQADLGGTVTQQMTDDAIKTKQSFDDLGTAISGVANRLGDDLGKRVDGYAESAAKWIGANRDTADSIAKISTAIAGIVALKPLAVVLRLLGLGGVAGAAGTAGTLASPLLLSGDSGPDAGTAPGGAFFGNNGAFSHWWSSHAPSWMGGGSGGGTKNPADPAQLRGYFRSQRWTDPQIAGILGNYQGESAMNAGAVGDMGASAGLGQWRDGRRQSFRLMFGHDVSKGTPMEQAQFTQWELTHTEKTAGDHLRATTSAREAGSVFSRDYERPKDVEMNAALRGQYAVQFLPKGTPLAPLGRPQSPPDGADSWAGVHAYGDNFPLSRAGYTKEQLARIGEQASAPSGHVQVDVHLHGAPAGTTAKVATSGPVTAPPPRIETPMPMVN